MEENNDRVFGSGIPNPYRHGLSMRYSNGKDPDQAEIVRAAELLGREHFYIDKQGYENEIIGAAVHPDNLRIIYVETRAKEEKMVVDITIKIHYRDEAGKTHEVDIESYNPYFGCDIRMIQWVNDRLALLVYREKHRTYIYRVGDQWPPSFAEIEDVWQMKDDVLSYVGYKPKSVQRRRIPSLEPMPSISLEEAEQLGQLPKDDTEGMDEIVRVFDQP